MHPRVVVLACLVRGEAIIARDVVYVPDLGSRGANQRAAKEALETARKALRLIENHR